MHVQYGHMPGHGHRSALLGFQQTDGDKNIDPLTDMCIDMRIDVCIDMCIDNCIDKQIDT